MRNKGVLYRFEKGRIIVHTIKARKVYWIRHILRRNCFIKQITEVNINGRTEVMG
jgi:hypothetical protein